MRYLAAMLVLWPGLLYGATLTTDGSDSDVIAKITAADNGDRITLPGSTYTWDDAVTIPNTKWIILDGQGSKVTLNAKLRINGTTQGNTRITNCTFTIGLEYGLELLDTPSTAAWIIEGCTIKCPAAGSGIMIYASAQGASLIYNTIFTNMNNAAQEFMHTEGWGASDTTGWEIGVTPGGTNMMVIEDCKFLGPAGANNAWIQNFYGSRVTIRHNLFANVGIDVHGGGGIGGRWWEIYCNRWTNAPGDNMGTICNIRAGSGIICSNISDGVVSLPNAAVKIGHEQLTVGTNYHAGLGTLTSTSPLNFSSDPAYVWNNTNGTTRYDPYLNSCECTSPYANLIQENEEVFFSAKSYSMAPYPHPLRGEGSEEPPAAAPRTISAGRVTVGRIGP